MSHTRCTDVVRILDCTAIDVAVSGNRCALLLASTSGITKVLLPLSRFIEGARGPRDCNGNPFPAAQTLRKRDSEEVFLEDALATRPKAALIEPSPAVAPAAETVLLSAADSDVRGEVSSMPTPSARGIQLPLRPLPDLRDRAAREQALREAWEVYIAEPTLTLWDLSRQLDCRTSWLRRRFDGFAAEPGAPVLKPGGKL